MTNSGETENFGKLLRMMMVHADVTQADLARHLGVRRPSVTDWVNGTHLPRYRDLILQMAQFLGASEEQTQQLLAAAVMPHLWPEGIASAHKVTISQLRQEHVERVAVFSQAIPLAWGQAGDMRQAYVHARLEPVEATAWPPQDRAISANTVEKSQLADSLLLTTSCHVAILAPAGSGKSVLWRWLVRRVAQGAVGDLIPVPIDWEWVRAGNPGNVISLLELVMNRIGLNPDAPSTALLAEDLLAQLETGVAIAVIDNWSGFEGLPATFVDQVKNLFTSKTSVRLVVFGRYEPLHSDFGRLDLYRLMPLNAQEVQRFVQAWPMVTGKALDIRQTVDAIASSTMMSELASSPLFLDLACAAGTTATFPQQRWALLDWAVQQMLEAATGSGLAGLRLRSALAELALSGYLNQASNLPMQFQFDAARIEQLWRTQLGNRGEELFRFAYEHGLLRTIVDEQQMAFSHQVVQSFLAAEAWINHDRWLEQVAWAKSEPPWVEVIVFAAAALAHNARLAEVERLLQAVCERTGSDVADLDWLLAGQCLAELRAVDQMQLDHTEIGQLIRQHLVERLRHPGSIAIALRLQDLLPQMQGEAWTTDVAMLARDQTALLWSRYAAIDVLGQMGNAQAIEALSQIALDALNEERIRLQAIAALGNTHAPEALAALENLLLQPTWTGWVVEALSVHNSPGAALLLFRVWDGTQVVGEAIRKLSHPLVLPILRQALEADPDPALTDFLLEAVANVGNNEGSAILRPYLRAEEWAIFEHVAGLLGTMKSQAACDVLLDYAEDERNSWQRRGQVVRVLPREPGLWDVKRLVQLLLMSDRPVDSDLALNATAGEEHGTLYQVVASAAAILAETADAEIDVALEQAVEQAASSGRALIARVLTDKPARSQLIALMTQLAHDRSYSVQHEALLALGRWHITDAADLALHLLERDLSKGRDVSRLCLAVSHFKEQRAVPLLASILQTREQPAAYDALTALAMIGGAEANTILITQGQHWLEAGRGEWLQQVLARVLAENGEAASVRLLIGLGTAQKEPLSQLNILQNLTQVRNTAAVEVLIEALSHPLDDIRDYAAVALGHIGDERAIPHLIALAFDPIEWVRESVVKAVRDGFTQIEWGESIRAAAQALRHAEPNVRYLGLIILSKAKPAIVSPDSIHQIRLCLETDEAAGVRRVAVKTLGKLTGAGSTRYLCELLRQSQQADWTITLLETLHDSGDPSAVETMLEVLQRKGSTGLLDMFASPWRYLLRIEFLNELIRFLPVTQPLIARLSLAYDIRVLPDGSVCLPDGRRLSRDAAVRWLKIERSG